MSGIDSYPSRAARRDAVRNRRLLLDAAGKAMRTAPEEATMPAIAESAGLSTATAYRYFPSLPDLLNEYLHEVHIQLRDFSHDCPARGSNLYSEVVDEWLHLVSVYGRTMVHLRPRTGLLARLHDRDTVITTSRDAMERPIRAVLRQQRIDDANFEAAFFLHNMLFDAREVLDLLDQGMELSVVKQRLIGAFVGAIRGWVESLKPAT